MKYFLSVLAVLSAPMVYGVICVPLVGVLMSMNANLINDMGGTDDFALILQIEAAQLVMLVIIGFVVAAIARFRPMTHVLVATGLMLAIGISVQLGFWDSMPAWHHFVFFACIAVGMPCGGYLKVAVAPKDDTAPSSG